MTLSAYFMSKPVFNVQGCRALTLARLSCQLKHWPQSERKNVGPARCL